MSFDPLPFPLIPSLLQWLQVLGATLGIALVVAFLSSLLSGDLGGFFRQLRGGIDDFLSLSMGRVYAIAQLTFREAIRRKALAVFVVFAVLFMFAGWFISDSGQKAALQVKVHVVFVMWSLSTLSLIVVLLLACWGIPEDIRVRSLHTVVTKPVRRLEVVLGRILGFSVIGMLVLVVMSAVGYVWILRQVPAESRSELTCRRPIYGSLAFLDRTGAGAEAGINVGDTWMFRSYIEGSTKARAIWTFNNIGESSLTADGNLQLESRFQAFRSHKGNMDRPLLFQYIFVNPETGLRVPQKPFEVLEFVGRTDLIPRKLSPFGAGPASVKDAAANDTAGSSKAGGSSYDLLTDLVTSKGQLTIEVFGVDPGQYLGMARPDLFIRTPDAWFAAGYFKSVLGIAMMLLLVVVIGVTASTFVKGPVATLLTFCLVIVGQWAREFMSKVADGTNEGGGMLESIYRIVMHMNPSVALPEGFSTTVMKTIDSGFINFVWLVRQILPNFRYFDTADYVANGFDVPFDAAVLPSILVPLAFFIPCVLLAHYSLRLRELEAK